MINPYALWFKRVMLAGVVVNLLLALPAVLVPNAVLALVGGEPAIFPIWPAFAGLLLVLLSLFYIPPALDPFRHRAAAWLSVLARWAGVWFFLGLQDDFHLFGYLDLVFALPETVLLVLTYREEGRLS
ncbi:MAG: hypothetical protein R3310_01910 [Candidatus Competibacteraceae bacterium]|nr:hypothetical protein [Candidatus Competibacteraceae bacterium]